MSGQHAHADAVPSPTLVGEGSVDYTHVCIMVGHDDDVVLDPRLFASRPRNAKSRWEGQQSDMAIAQSMLAQFPQLRATFARTNEDLLATDAKVILCADTERPGPVSRAHTEAQGSSARGRHHCTYAIRVPASGAPYVPCAVAPQVVLVLSYLTQVSYGWYAEFFQTLKTLEARGVAVYPSAEFKEFISSKASYMQLLQEQGRRVCPTQILHRSECVGVSGGGAAGGTSEISASEIGTSEIGASEIGASAIGASAISAARVEVRMRAALTALGLLAPSGEGAPCQLVRVRVTVTLTLSRSRGPGLSVALTPSESVTRVSRRSPADLPPISRRSRTDLAPISRRSPADLAPISRRSPA